MSDKAIAMFVDLRQWDEAKVFAASSKGSVDAKDLTRRQAEWAEEVRPILHALCTFVFKTIILFSLRTCLPQQRLCNTRNV